MGGDESKRGVKDLKPSYKLPFGLHYNPKKAYKIRHDNMATLPNYAIQQQKVRGRVHD
jgi:hypothetical protein